MSATLSIHTSTLFLSVVGWCIIPILNLVYASNLSFLFSFANV